MTKSPETIEREYRLLNIFAGMERFMPLRLIQWKGAFIGALFFLLHPRRRIVLENLRRVFPDRSGLWRLKTGMKCGAHFGRIALDFIKTSLLTEESFRRLVRVEGLEHVTKALKFGRGAFILSGHFGHWEIASQALTLAGYPQAMIVRPMDNPRIEAFIAGARTRFGNTLIPKKGAGRESIKVLQENGLIDILIDQYVDPSIAVQAPFLGINAPTTPFLAKLALRRRVPVVPLFSYPSGKGYRVVLHEPILPDEGDDILSLTTRFNDVVSHAIRQSPHLWLWFHDRWGIRKGGEK